MSILVIEDDANKLANVCAFLEERFSGLPVATRRSYRGGLAEAVRPDAAPDCILLDMTLPTYDVSASEKGGRIRPFGGREILNELVRRGVRTHVIVVTQFESFGDGRDALSLAQLRDQLETEYRGTYVATVFYHPAELVWKDQLEASLKRALESMERGA
jgi:CheY-like chemotaxis protein